jgi:transposase-like protein
MSLYRAVVSQGNILEFLHRDCHGASHTTAPRVITITSNVAYPKAFHECKAVAIIEMGSGLPQTKYFNNHFGQHHQ